MTKKDLNNKLSKFIIILIRKITENKNELEKLKTFDSSYFRGKSKFSI